MGLSLELTAGDSPKVSKEKTIGCVEITIFKPVIPAEAGIQWLSVIANYVKSSTFYGSGFPFPAFAGTCFTGMGILNMCGKSDL